MSATQDLQGLLEQCRKVRATYEDDALVIVPAATVEELLADAAELRNLQRLIARLPDDDWDPFSWAVLSLAQEAARTALAEVPL